MKARLGQILIVVAMLVMFVMAAGAPGSYGHSQPPKGQIGQGQPGPPPGQLHDSVNWLLVSGIP